jgi:hypothetical protein
MTRSSNLQGHRLLDKRSSGTFNAPTFQSAYKAGIRLFDFLRSRGRFCQTLTRDASKARTPHISRSTGSRLPAATRSRRLLRLLGLERYPQSDQDPFLSLSPGRSITRLRCFHAAEIILIVWVLANASGVSGTPTWSAS